MERTMTENLAVNQTAKDLIYLVSCGVNDEKPDLQRCLKMDLHEICKSAHRHSLVGMAALVLEQVKALPADFIEEKFKVIRRMSLYDLEIPKVLDALEKNKIWYLPLKGTLIRKLYPQLQMREMGDCDILCDPSRAADIRKLMKSMGYNGVDTTGTRFADTRYGTVIYDLDEDSILQSNVTDAEVKQITDDVPSEK